MGIIAYEWLSSVTLDQTVGVYQNSLQSAREYSDKQFSDLKKLSLQLAQTGWVKKYMTRDFSVYQEEQLDLKKYNEELLVYNVANEFIDDIAIYFHNRGKVLSSTGVNDFEFFFMDNFRIKGVDLKGWGDILSKNNQSELIYTNELSTYGQIRSGIIYLQSYPVDLKSDFRATLLIFINKNTLSKSVSSLFPGQDTQVYIFNENYDHIAGSNTNVETAIKVQELIITGEITDDKTKIEINGDVNLVFTEISQSTGWVYAAILPRAAVMRDVRRIQTLIALLVALSSITGVFVSYVLANHSYKPVEGLLKVLGTKSIPRENEFELIKNEIVELVNQDKQLKERMEYDKPTLVDAYLAKLLSKNENECDEIVKILEWFGIRFKDPFHCCITISRHDKAQEGLPADYLIDVGKQRDMTVYTTGDEDKVTLICGYSNEEQLKEYIDTVFNYLKGSGLYITIGVGTGCSDISRLYKSFMEAEEALDYHLIKNEKCSILFYETINRHWYYYYPADKEASLIQSLRAGNLESALSMFDHLLSKNMPEDHINMVIVRYFFFYSLMSAYSLCKELNVEGAVKDGNDILSNCQDISEMKGYIRELYKKICDSVNTEKKSHNTKLKDDIYEYIENNLYDESITLAGTADEFGISSSYLSRFFKEQYGCNFLDYIHRKRICIAKKMLEDCNKPINQVMIAVGYNNTVTFRRLFKKYEGLSPGQYRDKICGEK
jgi:AraC-like DNA-binding protein